MRYADSVSGSVRVSSALQSRGGVSSSQRGASSLRVSPSARRLRVSQPTEELRKPPPLLHELRRKEDARLINLENYQIAKKLISVRASRNFARKLMDSDFERHQRAKALLCKLPVIDMSKNSFSPRPAGPSQRGSS